MPRGQSDIPELRLEVLQGLVTKFTAPPNLLLMNLFPESDAVSNTIKWESQEGTRGMTPFVPPGAPAPETAPVGLASHSAEAAYWKEKMYFDEEFLNNLRQAGTVQQYQDSRTTLAKETARLTYRCMRRKEWMFAKMLFDGAINYNVASGTKLGVDYGIPANHQVTLTSNYKWGTGTTPDILGDIMDAKQAISDACGANVDYAICSTQVLKYLAADKTIRELLQKSMFGDGSLFSGTKSPIVGVNTNVISGLLNIPNLVIYDEKFEARAYLTGAIIGGSTTSFTVEDASDFVTGSPIRFVDVSAGTYEDRTISAITNETNTITLSSAPSNSYRAGEDYVFMRRNFVADNKFVMFASTVEGQKIAEFKRAPFGLDRHYGIKADVNQTWDPEGMYIRVQDKGLPVLYQNDAVYILTVE
jgi:hypothetical protein